MSDSQQVLSEQKRSFLVRANALIKAKNLQVHILQELSKVLSEYDDRNGPLLPGFTQYFINNYLNGVNKKKDRSISAIFFNELIYAHKKGINDFSAISNDVLLDGSKPIPKEWKNTPEIYGRATQVSQKKSYIDKNGIPRKIEDEPKIHPLSHNDVTHYANSAKLRPSDPNQEANILINEEMALTLGAKFENPFILDPANRLHVGGGIYAGYGTLEEVIFFCSNMGLRLEDLVDLNYYYDIKNDCIKVSYKVPLTHDINSDNLYSYYAKDVTIFAQADSMEDSKEHRHKLTKPYKAGIGILAGYDMRNLPESDRASLLLPNGQIDWVKFKHGTKEKYRHEIEVARFYEHDSLVLCMLSCGAFLGNDNPTMVKRMVSEALAELAVEYQPYFKNIMISIPGEWDKELRDIVSSAMVKAYEDRAKNTTLSISATTTTTTTTATTTATSTSTVNQQPSTRRDSDPIGKTKNLFTATEKLNKINVDISYDSKRNLSLKLHDLDAQRKAIIHDLCQHIPGIFKAENGNEMSLLIPNKKVELFENYLRMLRPQQLRGITSTITLLLLEHPDFPKEMPDIKMDSNGLLNISYLHHPESNKVMDCYTIEPFLKHIGLKEEHMIVLFDIAKAQLPKDYIVGKVAEMQNELEKSVKEKKHLIHLS